jgi:hypothetical protein
VIPPEVITLQRPRSHTGSFSRADHVVRTGLSRHHAQRAIRRLVRELAP